MDSVVLTRLVLLFAGVAIVLGFQHYLTMLGTAVLIPLLIIRAIGGEAVRLFSFPQSACLVNRTVFVDFYFP